MTIQQQVSEILKLARDLKRQLIELGMEFDEEVDENDPDYIELTQEMEADQKAEPETEGE